MTRIKAFLISYSGPLSAIVLLLAWLLVMAAGARAQDYSLELGGALYASSVPHTAGYATLLVGGDLLGAEDTRSYTTIELRPLNGQATHTIRTGFERTLFSDARFELSASAQGGIATSATATSGAFAGGLGLLWKPAFLKGLHLSIGAEALDAPAIATWEPQVRLGIRYRFGSQ